MEKTFGKLLVLFFCGIIFLSSCEKKEDIKLVILSEFQKDFISDVALSKKHNVKKLVKKIIG